MKIIKYLVINILVLLLVLSCFEFILAKKYLKENPTESYHIGKVPFFYLFSKSDIFRTPSGADYTKRPVLIFGCSFAYGQGLNDEETFNYKLSKYSKRPVYNYAMLGKGIQSALFILQKKYYNQTIANPEYIIYVMMNDHVRRLYSNVCMGDYVGQPMYKLMKNNQIKLYKDYYPVYRQFYTFYYINNLIYNKYIRQDFSRHNRYITSYFNEMNNVIKSKYPNTKFVILIFGDNTNYGLDFSELEKQGFLILNTEDLTGVNFLQRKYYLSDTDFHPTADVWEITSKALIKELNL